MKKNTYYDVVIAGGSYAGLAAAMALGRALRSVLIIDGGKPCNRQTPHSHNFLTQDGQTPEAIAKLARQQVSKYGTVTSISDMVTHIKKNEQGFDVQTQSGSIFTASKIIFATGIKDLMPAIEGFSDCWGISVLHCPFCHGYEVNQQQTAIIGNGDEGFEMAKLISNWTRDLTLLTNGTSQLTSEQSELLRRRKIELVEIEIDRLEHNNGQLQRIQFTDGSATTINAIYAKLPFEQNTQLPQQLGCELTTDGYIRIDTSHETTVKGIYACGDNVTRMRTVANAVSMGTATGMMVAKALIEETFTSNKTIK